MSGLQLTATRLHWLGVLAKSAHPVPWRRMPKKIGTRRATAVTNATWRPMIEAGWITGKFETRDFRIGADLYFTITEAGRKVLAEGKS